jgi:hypothetical protein
VDTLKQAIFHAESNEERKETYLTVGPKDKVNPVQDEIVDCVEDLIPVQKADLVAPSSMHQNIAKASSDLKNSCLSEPCKFKGKFNSEVEKNVPMADIQRTKV